MIKGFQAYPDSLPHLLSPLFYNLGDNTCTYGLAAFTDGKAEFLLKGDGGDEFDTIGLRCHRA